MTTSLITGAPKNIAKVLTSDAQKDVVTFRINNGIANIKQELGVDELLVALNDAKEIASPSVKSYLEKYHKKVGDIIDGAETETKTYADRVTKDDNMSLKNIEKLVATKWKQVYELQMDALNSVYPLAQNIVSKYMANFSRKTSPKMQ